VINDNNYQKKFDRFYLDEIYFLHETIVIRSNYLRIAVQISKAKTPKKSNIEIQNAE
jgi:hypothetical protein